MAKVVGYPVINSVVIPVLLAIVLNGAKLLARPGHRSGGQAVGR
jgi:hypothetical protein